MTTSDGAEALGGEVTPQTLGRRAIARASALMAAGTTVSRVLGLVRTILLATAIGQNIGWIANAFAAANTLPNLVYILIAGGTLNAILVPAVVRASRHPDGGIDYINRLITLTATIMFGVTLLALVLAKPLLYLSIGVGNGDVVDRSMVFVYWFLPQIFFYSLYTVFGHVLNARESFGPYTWAPAANNIVAIIGTIVFIGMFGRGDAGQHTEMTTTMYVVLAGSTTLGVIVQALILIPVLIRVGIPLRPRWGFKNLELGKLGRIGFWTFLMIALGQLGVLATRWAGGKGADRAEALLEAGKPLAAAGIPGLAALDNSYLVFMLPQSVLVVSLITAIFPGISRLAANHDLVALRSQLGRTTRVVSALMILASAVMIVLSAQIMWVIVPGPRAQAESIGLVLAAFTIGLVPFAGSFVQKRVFYAFEDGRTPFLIQVPVTILAVIGAVVALNFVGPASALAIAALFTAAGNYAGWWFGTRLVNQRLGFQSSLPSALLYGKLLIAAGVAVPIGALLAWALDDALWTSRGLTVLLGLMIGGVMAVVFVIIARILRVEELEELIAPLARRLAGRVPAAARLATAGTGRRARTGPPDRTPSESDLEAQAEAVDVGAGAAVGAGLSGATLITENDPGHVATDDAPSGSSATSPAAIGRVSVRSSLAIDRSTGSGPATNEESGSVGDEREVYRGRYRLLAERGDRENRSEAQLESRAQLFDGNDSRGNGPYDDREFGLNDAPGSWSSFVAEDLVLERIVGLDIVRGAYATEAADAARRAALVEHPALVPVLNVGLVGAECFIITEFYDWPTLADLFIAGPIDAELLRSIVGEAANGIDAGRRRGVHHGALTADCVQVSDTGELVVRGVGFDSAARGLPEQGAARRDVTSLVGLVFSGLTGIDPQTAGENAEDDLTPAPSSLATDVPDDLDRLCRVVLAAGSEGAEVPPEDTRGLIVELGPWQSIPTARATLGPPTSADAASSEPASATSAMPIVHLPEFESAAGQIPVRGRSESLAPPPAVDPSNVAGTESAAPAAPATTKDAESLDVDEITPQSTTDDGPTDSPEGKTAPKSNGTPDRVPSGHHSKDSGRVPPRHHTNSSSGTKRGGRRPRSEAAGVAIGRRPTARSIARTSPNISRAIIIGAIVLVIVAIIVAISAIGSIKSTTAERRGEPAPAATSSSASPTSSKAKPSPSSTSSKSPVEAKIASVSAVDAESGFAELPAKEDNAIDGDPDTEWKSYGYSSAEYGGYGKHVALVLTLDKKASVSSITVDLSGKGGDIQLREGPVGKAPSSKVLASGEASGGSVTLKPDKPIDAKDLTIWFDTLPKASDGKYRAEVSDIKVS